MTKWILKYQLSFFFNISIKNTKPPANIKKMIGETANIRSPLNPGYPEINSIYLMICSIVTSLNENKITIPKANNVISKIVQR